VINRNLFFEFTDYEKENQAIKSPALMERGFWNLITLRRVAFPAKFLC